MKKVKNQAYKTKLGHKRHLKAVARKHKTYTPKVWYAVQDGVIVDDTQHTRLDTPRVNQATNKHMADTETLDLS